MEGGITDIILCDELQKVFDTLKYTLGQVQLSEDFILFMFLPQFIQFQKDEETHGVFEYKAARPHGGNHYRTY